MAPRSRYLLGLVGVTVVVGLLVAGVAATRGGSEANAGDVPAGTARPSLVFREPTPAATAVTSFGAGSYVVGRDIALGRYSAGPDREVIANCFWQQTDAGGGELDRDGKDRPTQVLTLLTEGTRLVMAGENCTFERVPD